MKALCVLNMQGLPHRRQFPSVIKRKPGIALQIIPYFRPEFYLWKLPGAETHPTPPKNLKILINTNDFILLLLYFLVGHDVLFFFCFSWPALTPLDNFVADAQRSSGSVKIKGAIRLFSLVWTVTQNRAV